MAELKQKLSRSSNTLALEAAGQQVVLDLRDVTLVNESAVKFLAGCEVDSIKLENCPPIFGHELTTEKKVEEIGDANNRMPNY